MGEAVIILGSLSIILGIAAIIKHKRIEDTDWRSSIGRALAVFACCMAPFSMIFSFSILFCYCARPKLMGGFIVISGILAIVLAVRGIRECELKGRTLAMIVFLPAILEIGVGAVIVINCYK